MEHSPSREWEYRVELTVSLWIFFLHPSTQLVQEQTDLIREQHEEQAPSG